MPQTVLDLPQLYRKPRFEELYNVMCTFKREENSFEVTIDGEEYHYSVFKDLPRYLTNIIASPLGWLEEDQREIIWNLASLRISERAGRNANPAMTRLFKVSEGITITIHEPSLTEDNLGLKTWSSSLMLARRLPNLMRTLNKDHEKILELGAGTGLVGLAASKMASAYVREVTLTDLPDIVPNLGSNIELNRSEVDCIVNARILDWTDALDIPKDQEDAYPVILAADPIYTAEHPAFLMECVSRWLRQSDSSVFMLELPLRDGYEDERNDLRKRLENTMLMIDQGFDEGIDDWEDSRGRQIQVKYWWSLWRPKRAS